MPAPCDDSLSVSPSATGAAAAQERSSVPYRELFEELQSMRMNGEQCMQIQLIQTVERKQVGQRHLSACIRKCITGYWRAA